MNNFAPCFVGLGVAAGAAVRSRQHVTYNPQNAKVTEVHMVLSSHFDAGCKTPSCGKLAKGEPNLCAKVGAGNAHGAVDPDGTGEPYNYHILNRYFDVFLPRAVELAATSRGSDFPYTYMTQSWVLAMFMDCNNTGVVSWPGSGWIQDSSPVLHCPSVEDKAAVVDALKRGDIFMHAFPHDGEVSYYPDVSLFEAALAVTMGLSDELGIKRPTSISQRDVPGWTRAALPILNKFEINGLSFGAGTPPGKPDVPPICVWRDEATNSDVVLTYESAYGDTHTVFVLPNGVALVAAWEGDNTGPAPVDDVKHFYDYLRNEFPDANVTASTFDAFFDVANSPDIKSQLPVVTSEIGDAWLYGVPSDPLKNAQFREISRQRLACIQSGECDPTNDAMKAADRLIVKVPEHTWGIAQGWFLPDYVNYTNLQFDRARQQQGFIKNNTHHADYNTTVNSWIEQRTYVTAYPTVIESVYPRLSKSMAEAIEALENVRSPSTDGLSLVADAVGTPFTCGSLTVSFNKFGGLSEIKDVKSGTQWANETNVIGQFFYESFTNDDYNAYLWDFASRLDDIGVWPEHSPILNHGGCHYGKKSVDDMGCGNFRKPNVSHASPKRRTLSPSLQELWHGGEHNGACKFVVVGVMAEEAARMAGAPSQVVTLVSISNSKLDFEVIQLHKRPTRLPEATFVTFNPVADDDGWKLRILNTTVMADDALGRRGSSPDGKDWVFGGSPHMHGVEEVTWTGTKGSVAFRSLDVPIACIGRRSPFPTPRNAPAQMSYGLHWNIFNNIWNTNYVLWYPFKPEDRNLRSRFSMTIESRPLDPALLV